MIVAMALFAAGLLSHQSRRIIDGHPKIFTVGWRELTSYAIGSLCVLQLSDLVMKHYGMDTHNRRIARHSHIESLVLYGAGVALGWVIDGVVKHKVAK